MGRRILRFFRRLSNDSQGSVLTPSHFQDQGWLWANRQLITRRFGAFQGYQANVPERTGRVPLPYRGGSTELNMTTLQDPTHSKLRFRKAMQARDVQSTNSWILAFSPSTKPIMASRRATENFVARWCSGLA